MHLPLQPLFARRSLFNPATGRYRKEEATLSKTFLDKLAGNVRCEYFCRPSRDKVVAKG